jgi:prepilin-type N-terminal cleavage/methylation domain-containing protein
MFRKGVTLVELLVSIAILGILSLVVFSITKELRYRAWASRMASDFEQITTSYKAWQAINLRDATPNSNYSDPEPCQGRNNPRFSWVNIYYPDFVGVKAYSPVTKTEYRYDNDWDFCESPDPMTGLPRPNDGVNIANYTCTVTEADNLRKVTQILDSKLDGGDGYNLGTIQWLDGGSGSTDFGLFYRMSCR